MKLQQLNARQFRDEKTGWFLDTRSRFHITFIVGDRKIKVPKEGGRDSAGLPAMIVFVEQASWVDDVESTTNVSNTDKAYLAKFLKAVTESHFDNYIVRH